MIFSGKYETAIQWCINLHWAFELRGAVKGELAFDCTNAETNKAHLGRGGRSKNEREGEAERKSRESSRDKRQETSLLKGKEMKGTFQFWKTSLAFGSSILQHLAVLLMLSSIRYYCIQILIPSFLHRWSGVDIAVKWRTDYTKWKEQMHRLEWTWEAMWPRWTEKARLSGFPKACHTFPRSLVTDLQWLTHCLQQFKWISLLNNQMVAFLDICVLFLCPHTYIFTCKMYLVFFPFELLNQHFQLAEGVQWSITEDFKVVSVLKQE